MAKKKRKSAAERWRERWAEYRRQREEEERQSRVMVITEFDAGGDPEATMHAMAAAILEYRYALRTLGRAVDLARAGAPVGLIEPGAGWRPKRLTDGDVVLPAA